MDAVCDDASWNEFYGSSSSTDLTDLMDIFDAMIGGEGSSITIGTSHHQTPSIAQTGETSPLTVQTSLISTPALQRHFPVLKIVEPGDPDPMPIGMSGSAPSTGPSATATLVRSTSRGSGACPSPRRSVSFRSTETSTPSSSSSSSLASLSTHIHSTGSSQLTVESLGEDAVVTVNGGASSPNRRPRNGTNNDSQPHQHLRNSGDSGDSGVSSPGPPGSSGSETCGRAGSLSLKNSECGDSLSYMDRVVMEVIESEQTYVRDLEQVVQGYLYYWRDEGDRSPLTTEQASALFGNVDDIYRFNRQFLGQLHECGLDPVEVARCFVRNNAGFTIYTDYCTNYPRKVSVLTDLMRNEAASRACRERQTELQHTLPLGSYLLKPVQRILKYHLLLQNIVKHCDRTGTPGYSDIIVALSAMTGIAHHINDMKRKHEHAVRVQEVQSLLDGWTGEDLTTFGELVAEGSFRMYGAKAPRHVFLLDRMLLIVKRKEDGTLGYKAHIMCSNLMLIESVPGEPLSFHVIPFDNPRQQYTLEARNLEQKREWTLQLKRVILENYDAVIPHHARQLVLQLGQDPQRCANGNNGGQDRPNGGAGESMPNANLSSSTSVGNSKRHHHHAHSAPEYLERRKHSTASSSSSAMNFIASRKSRKSTHPETSSPKESPLLPRRLRRSLDSRSVSRDRSDQPERKYSTTSCPSEANKSSKGMKFAAWRRRSEPSREPNVIVSRPSSSMATEEVTVTEESAQELRQETESVQSEPVEPGTCPSITQHQRIVPESLERIVEQLVLQNVEIQRILQRKKRRTGVRYQQPPTISMPLNRSESMTLDEGIYDSLIQVSGLRSTDLVHESLSDADDDYVTIEPQGGGHFSRSQLRRSTDSTTRSRDAHSQQVQQQQQKATLTRSLSCPARGQQAIRVQKKASVTAASESPTSRVSGRIQKLLTQIGSPDNWSNWMRSLSPPMRRIETSDNKGRMDLNVIDASASPSTSPCVPSVWLRMQSEHLAEPGKKSGSLPRSFQTPAEGKSRWMDRPVTIASDRPAPIDALELYIRSQQERPSSRSTSNGFDDSMIDIPNTPRVSSENIHVHPDYKIYRRTASKSSLKTVLSSVSAKLSHLKNMSTGSASDFSWGSLFSLSHDDSSAPSTATGSPSSRHSRNKVLHYLVRRYAVLLKQRSLGNGAVSSNTPVAAQQIAAVGARMAGAADTSDYATLKYYPRATPSCYSTSRSDLSSSKSTASLASKTTWYGTLESTRDAAVHMMMLDTDSDEESEDDGSSSTDDSFFYERAFEAVEQMLDETDWCCRDSAVFSDDAATGAETPTVGSKPPALPSPARSQSLLQRHQLIRTKNRGLAILERMKSLEENIVRKEPAMAWSSSLENLKSISQRRSELTQAITSFAKPGDESETSSQHSSSTVNTVVEIHPKRNAVSPDSAETSPAQRRLMTPNRVSTSPDSPPSNSAIAGPLPKGWVKHIIGKLQGETK